MTVTTRDDKGRHATLIWDTAYNSRKFSENSAQLVNNRGDELKVGIEQLLDKLSTLDRFVDEERASTYTYPPEYKGPKLIGDQIDILRTQWPSLNPDSAWKYAKEVLPGLSNPLGAEGSFCNIRPNFFNNSYNDGVVEVLAAIASKRRFHNYRALALGPEYLRQHARTTAMLDQIGQQQKGDILIIPSQFGLRHRGRSVRRAREVIAVNPVEFGSCPFMVGSMALTHPERYVRWGQLHTDCPGGEYSPDADGTFSVAPFFDCSDIRVRLYFGASRIDVASDDYGSVSGFLPQ